MSQCCVCKDAAKVTLSGAAFCGAPHASMFYDKLRNANKSRVIANQPLSESTIQGNSVRCSFEHRLGMGADAKNLLILTEEFRNLRWVRNGDNCRIYRGSDNKNDTFDIKVYSPDTSHQDIKREINNVTELREELEDYGEDMLRNVIKIHGAYLAKTPYYELPVIIAIMEYVDGLPLTKYLKNAASQINMQQWIRFYIAIMRIVAEMRDVEIAHRNISTDTIFVRHSLDNPVNFDRLSVDFVLTDFEGSCSKGFCNDEFESWTAFTSPDMVGYPHDESFRENLMSMSNDEKFSLYAAEDVYAMTMVAFVVLNGAQTYLQEILLKKEIIQFKRSKRISPDDKQAIDIADKERRRKLLKMFADYNMLRDIRFTIEKNPNLSEQRDYENLFEIYQWTIGAWAKQRKSASEMLAIAQRIERKYR